MMPGITIDVYRSPFPCWKCGNPLVELRPNLDGWCYYCLNCQHLTSTQGVLDKAISEKPGNSVGIVAAVKHPLNIAWEKEPPK